MSNIVDSERLSSFLKFLREVKQSCNSYEEVIDESDKQTQDILHQIELGPYKDRQKFCTKLAHVRRQRRVAKDYIEIHKEINELLKDSVFNKYVNTLEQILGSMRKHENNIKNQRFYRPRVRVDLTIHTAEKKENQE